MTENRGVVAWGREVARMNHKDTFVGVRYVRYIDFGDEFTGGKYIQYPKNLPK